MSKLLEKWLKLFPDYDKDYCGKKSKEPLGILLIALNRGRNDYDFNIRFKNQKKILYNFGSLQKQTHYNYQK